MFKKLVWVATILWMAMIFYFSSQPVEVSRQASGEILAKMNKIEPEEIQDTNNSKVSKLQFDLRKFAHVVVYFGLGFLVTLSLYLIKYKRLTSYVLAYIASVIYALSDEWHQSFVPGRGATILDIKIDTLSALAGVVIAAGLIEVIIFLISIKKKSNAIKMAR